MFGSKLGQGGVLAGFDRLTQGGLTPEETQTLIDASLIAGDDVEFGEIVGAGGFAAYASVSAEIDLVNGVGSFYQIIPACPYKLVRFFSGVSWLTTVGGTRSVVGSIQVGANAAANDMVTASAYNAATLTQAADTISTFFGSGVISPAPVLDLTANGLRLKVVSAMTGTAPVCKVRISCFAALWKI